MTKYYKDIVNELYKSAPDLFYYIVVDYNEDKKAFSKFSAWLDISYCNGYYSKHLYDFNDFIQFASFLIDLTKTVFEYRDEKELTDSHEIWEAIEDEDGEIETTDNYSRDFISEVRRLYGVILCICFKHEKGDSTHFVEKITGFEDWKVEFEHETN